MNGGHWELIAPGRYRWVSGYQKPPPARSRLPMPHVISDEMPPTEQVDGRFYTSKQKFRATGRALGLTEVGNDPQRLEQRKTRGSISEANKQTRRDALRK